MIDWGSVLGLGTAFGAVLGLLVGHLMSEKFVPKDHGAGMPQHPKTGIFKTDENTFYRWLLVELCSALSGAIIGHLAEPAILRVWNSMTDIEQIGAAFVSGLLLLAILDSVYRSQVYES